ncbi:MAG: hypothetical protein ACXVIS_03100 [Halobacteriota archaeon]
MQGGVAVHWPHPVALDRGPVVPTAEKAVETNDATEAIGFVLQTMEDDLHNLSRGHTTKNCGVNEVRAGREFVDS